MGKTTGKCILLKDGVCRNEKKYQMIMKFSAPEIIKTKLPTSRVYIVTELNYPWLTEFFYDDGLITLHGWLYGRIYLISALFCCLCSVLPVAALPIEPLTIQFLGQFFVFSLVLAQ